MTDILIQELAKALAPYLIPFLKDELKDESPSTTSSTEDELDLIPKSEVCSLLNVKPVTLWRWEKAEYLKPVKIGNKVMYRKSDLKNLVK